LDASQYGKDRVFVVFKNENDAEPSDTTPLMKAGHPVMTVTMDDDYKLGQHMYVWEMATAVAAHFLGVNPFDQPDVEATKKYTRAVIADLDKEPVDKPAMTFEQIEMFGNVNGTTPAEAFKIFYNRTKSGDYICLQNYLSPSPEIDAAINLLREAISKKYFLPVTFGYGPRYLHSTGQLHKGDAGNGIFIQLTQDYAVDEKIPDASCTANPYEEGTESNTQT